MNITSGQLFEFVDWVSLNRYTRTITGEWFKDGIADYSIIAKNTEELYIIFLKEKEKK